MIVAITLIIFVGFAWALRNMAAGRTVYAVGSDAEAARLAGINCSECRVLGIYYHGRAGWCRRLT